MSNDETPNRFEELNRDSEESNVKLETETESSIKSTIVTQEHPKTNPEDAFSTTRDFVGVSDTLNTESTEKTTDDKLVSDGEKNLESIDQEDSEINEKSQDRPNNEYPITSTSNEDFSTDAINKENIQPDQREDGEEISPDSMPPEFVSEPQTDDMIGGPLPGSDMVTDEIVATQVFPEYIPEEMPNEPIEPPIDETSMEEDDMDPNPPSIISDDGLPIADPLPVADDIIEEGPESPPEEMENEDSGPINII